MSEYEAIMDGGGPWGIRLQGGKDFGVPLNVARVTPGSKAGNKRIMAGDTILVINGTSTETLTHLEAQNLIKNAGSRLQLKLRTGKGVSLGEVKQVGGGSFAASPSKTLYTTDVTHSAGVDHKFNSKPKAFGASPTGGSTTQIKKFDPAEYARKKKEELDKYKEEQKKPAVAPDSDVLRMLQNTSISDNQQSSGSFSRLQRQLSNEGEWAEQEKSFRMTADGTDLTDVSPGSRAVMDDIRNRGSAGLSSSGSASGGSKSFKFLQQLTDQDADPKSSVFVAANEKRDFMPQPAPSPVLAGAPNLIMNSLKTRMKEMNIDKEKLDRTSSVSRKDFERGRYLSASSYESAERPPSPRPTSPISPDAPVFRMAVAKDTSKDAGGSNNVIASLKTQLQKDRLTLGLKQTRGTPRSPVLRRMQHSYIKKDQKQDVNGNTLPCNEGGPFQNFVNLPPPPPELMDGHEPNYQRASFGNTEGLSNQSGTFKRLQQHVEDGTADQVQTVFGQPRGMRGQPVPAPQPSQIQRNTATTANPLPKAPMPTGPNFKVGRASAPTFKPNPVLSFNQPKPAPQAVNAGEIVNPNSRQYNPYASRTSPGYTSPTERFSPSSRVPPTSPPAGPPPTPPSTVNVIKSKSVPQPVPSGNNEKELHCHACQQQLMGPFVSAIGKTWHPEHFCCSACNVSLQNQAFVEENNQLFCEKCYNQYYAPKCAHCNNAIIGDVSYRHGVICNQCSSMATTSGMNDPIVCSQSINWLIEQIREANVTYESATSKNADSMERYRVAKMSMAAMNKKRTRLEAEIEEYERNFLTTKRLAEYKQKVFAANANLTQNEKKLTTKISQVESSLNASRSSLSTWKSKLDVISENYRSKKKRLNQLLAAQKQHRGVTQAVEGDLWEMSERIKALQVKDDLRQLRMNALVDEINVVANNTKEVESRSLLAEQHLASLRLYQETIDEEYMQIRIQTLDARDSVELAKRKKKDLMRQNHIYF